MEIADFLLARIAEDEATALAARDASPVYELQPDAYDEMLFLAGGEGASDEAQVHAACYNPSRVLADCEAKRRIVEKCDAAVGDVDWDDDNVPTFADETLRLLALPYAGHPDYRGEWRAADG